MMSEEDEDVLFDRSGVLVIDQHSLLPSPDDTSVNDGSQTDSPIHVPPQLTTVVPSKGRVLQTVCLCAAFFGLGLCIAIPGPTLLDLQEQTNTDTETISRIFTGRSVGYLFGSMVGGFLFDRINQTCLLSLSLLLTAVGTAAAPWCTNIILLVSILAFQGVSMGFLDTGGNVLCLYTWGRNSGPYMQAMHFAYGVGAFVAPLIAEPFLSQVNTTNITVYENVTFTLETSTLGSLGMLHRRYVREADGADLGQGLITPATPPLKVDNTTISPKHPKPDAADGKFLSQKGNIADGSKIGQKIQDIEKDKAKNQQVNEQSLSTVMTFHFNSSGTNGTLDDTGQELDTPSTTTTTTTTTTVATTTTTTTTTTPTPLDSENDSKLNNDNDTSSNDTINATEINPVQSKDPLQKLKNTFSQVAHTVTHAFNSLTKVQFAYLLIAGFILLVAFMFMFQCCCTGHCSCRSVKHQDVQADYLIKKESLGFRVQILILLFVFYFLYVGMEVTYGGLIMTFAVKYMHWSKAKGTVLTSVFWGSFAAGRGLAIPLAKCLTPAIMLVADLVLSTLSLAGLVIGLSTNHIMLWFCTATLGVGMASIFPTGITWAERYMHVTGKTTAVFVVGSALGEMLLPMITGFLFQNKSPMWLMYIMLGCAFFSLVIYIVMQNLATGMGERYERLTSSSSHREKHSTSNSVPLHSIDSDDNGDDMETDLDSVPLIAGAHGAGDLHGRKKKVTFNLRAAENGSIVSHNSKAKTTSFTKSHKGSILKGRTSDKHD